MNNMEYYESINASFTDVKNAFLKYAEEHNDPKLNLELWLAMKHKFNPNFNRGDIVSINNKFYITMSFDKKYETYWCLDYCHLVSEILKYDIRPSTNDESINLILTDLYTDIGMDSRQDIFLNFSESDFDSTMNFGSVNDMMKTIIDKLTVKLNV